MSFTKQILSILFLILIGCTTVVSASNINIAYNKPITVYGGTSWFPLPTDLNNIVDNNYDTYSSGVTLESNDNITYIILDLSKIYYLSSLSLKTGLNNAVSNISISSDGTNWVSLDILDPGLFNYQVYNETYSGITTVRYIKSSSYSPLSWGSIEWYEIQAYIESADTLPATNITSSGAQLNGYIDAEAALFDTVVWFEWGPSSGSYSFRTEKQDIADIGAGNFSAILSGLSIRAKNTYYYRAVAQCEENGIVYGDEVSFTAASLSPISDYDFDKNYNELVNDSFVIPSYAGTLPLTFTDVMGTFFWGLFFMMVFVVMWIRQDDVTNVSIIGLISSGVILTMLPVAWHPAANALAIISFAGLLVSWIYKK